MHYLAFEHVVRISVDGEADALSVFYVAYIGFIDIGDYLHLRQVGGDGEQGRGFEAGGNGLSFFNGAVDNDTVYRAGDGRVFQVAVYLHHRGLVLFVSSFGLFVVVGGRFVIGVAD